MALDRYPKLPLDQAPHKIPSGVLLFKEKGKDYSIRLGNARGSSFTLGFEDLEERDRQDGDRALQKRYSIDKSGTLSLQLVQETEIAKRIAAMAAEDTFDQASGTALTTAYANAVVGATYDLTPSDGMRRRMVSNVVVTDTAGTTTYVAGTHYRLQSQNGTVTILDTPDGAGPGLAITFDCAAISGRPFYGVHTLDGLEGEVRISQDNMTGENLEYVFPRVEFRTDGEQPQISENNELMVFNLNGTLYKDDTLPLRMQWGYAMRLEDPAAA